MRTLLYIARPALANKGGGICTKLDRMLFRPGALPVRRPGSTRDVMLRNVGGGHRLSSLPSLLPSAARTLPLEMRQIPLCSIQTCRHPPIDVFLVDLPVIDCGGG